MKEKRFINLQVVQENRTSMLKKNGKVSKLYSKEKISDPVILKSRMKNRQSYPVGHSKDF